MYDRSFPKLGWHILIVVDCEDGCVKMMEQVVKHLPGIHNRHFTLVHYMPTVHWEHGGGSTPEKLQKTTEQVWKAERKLHSHTDQYFGKVRTILEGAGVPTANIRTKFIANASDLVGAVTQEIRSCDYSGVILSCHHRHLASILKKQSFVRWFMPPLPDVAVLMMERSDVFAPEA